jgi:hypothetical protein
MKGFEYILRYLHLGQESSRVVMQTTNEVAVDNTSPTHPDSFYNQEDKSGCNPSNNGLIQKSVQTGSPDNLEETLGVGSLI